MFANPVFITPGRYISIKFKKEWSRLVIPDFYVLELFAVLFLNVFLS